MAISARGRRLIAVAGALAVIVLLYLLLRGDEAGQPDVEPAPAPAPQAAAPPVPAAAPAPTPDASGLRLHGLLASGAILGFADGSQRLVRTGREALPGLTVVRIEPNHVVLASAGGEIRLGFDGPSGAPATAQTAAPASSSSETALREESLRYRVGLEPRRAGGRVAGFTVRRGADLPQLQRAGIRPGDTILGVNGSVLDEERMQELAWTIANSTRTEFEVERGGRRLRMAIQGR